MNTLNHPFIDYAREINSARRRCRVIRFAAWCCVLVALVLLGIALGCLCAAGGSIGLSLLGGLIILLGIQSFHYLLTRHQ